MEWRKLFPGPKVRKADRPPRLIGASQGGGCRRPAPEGQQINQLRVSEGGGAYRDRTDDLMLAKQPLSQLS